MLIFFAIPVLVVLAAWGYDLTKAFRYRRATVANLERVIRGA